MSHVQLAQTSLATDANLVAYYKLENTSDSKGSNTLTNNNSVAFNAALFNNGADLGAANTNKYLSVAGNLGIAGNGDISISFWVKAQAEIASGSWIIMNHYSQTGADHYIALNYLFNGGTRQLQLDGQGTSTTYNITLGTSNWYNLVMTRSVSNNRARLYVNDVQQTTNTLGAGAGGSNGFGIGSLPTGASYASALFDDISVFNRELAQADVDNIYNSAMSGGLIIGSL